VQLIITDPWFSKKTVLYLRGRTLLWGLIAFLGAVVVLTLAFRTHLAPTPFTAEGEKRYVRENLDAMAKRLGELQARLIQLDSLNERVLKLAGLSAPPKNHPLQKETQYPPGMGGTFIPGPALSAEDINQNLHILESASQERLDLLTVLESRLSEQRAQAMLMPTFLPVLGGEVGSPFGWRIDPFNGQWAMHSGLDFAAPSGTKVFAASGGVVVSTQQHPAYGNLLEIDHGKHLVTRYAHLSKFLVKEGDLVKRGQAVAEIGSTGRSTGPHLHFEVLVQGVQQDPQKFLALGQKLPFHLHPVAKADLQ
jgi:murein DD-endopeptidase MepM/ murein hydrolase activator NlpD